jgi:AAA domain
MPPEAATSTNPLPAGSGDRADAAEERTRKEEEEKRERARRRIQEYAERRHKENQMVRNNNPLLLAVVEPGDVDGDGEPLAAGGDFIVPGESVGIVYGKREGGKSMSMVDFGCSLATGNPWLGLSDIVRGPLRVLYLQLEGPREQVQHRINAWSAEHGITTEPRRFTDFGEPLDGLVHIRPDDFDLTDPGAREVLIEAVQADHADVLIVDTLDAGRPSGSNMVDGDVGAIFVRTLPAVCDYGVSVILVAHSNESDRSLAGLSRQANHAEWMIHVQELKGGNRIAILDKQKDVPGKPSIPFHIVDSPHVHPITGRPVGVVRVGSKVAPKRETSAPAPPSDDEVMLRAVAGNPGSSLRHLRGLAKIKGGAASRDAALNRLIDAGRVRVETVGQKHEHFAI